MSLTLLDLTDHTDFACLITGFLSVKDVCIAKESCKALQQIGNLEIGRRIHRWKCGTSFGWPLRCRYGYISPDDLPFGLASAGLPASLQMYAPSRDAFFGNIAHWCGGWEALLHAREMGPASPPVEGPMSTPGPHPGGAQLLIFDIHQNNEWKWSAIVPPEAFGCMRIFPVSSKSLGQRTDAATVHDYLSHIDRHNHYFLTTTADDSDEWVFSLGILSPSCSETLFCRQKVVPSQVCKEIENSAQGWVPNSGLGLPLNPERIACLKELSSFTDDDLDSLDIDLLRHAGKMNKFHLRMINQDGNIVSPGIETQLWYYLDRRQAVSQQVKLHINLDLFIDDIELFRGMIVRPPPDVDRAIPEPAEAVVEEDGWASRQAFHNAL